MSLENICFGYLDNTDAIGNLLVADKMKQLTMLYQTTIIDFAPSFVAKTLEELHAWSRTTCKKYLLVQSFGHIVSKKALVAALDSINPYSMGLVFMRYPPENECDNAAFLVGTQVMLGTNNVSYFPQEFIDNCYYLYPEESSEALELCLVSYQTHEYMLTRPSQRQYLSSLNGSYLGFLTKAKAHDPPFKYQYGTGKVSNYYCLAGGFKGIIALAKMGFDQKTTVFQFHYGATISFDAKRRIEWDGVNFMDSYYKFINSNRFQFSSTFSEVERSWNDALEECGGEREFKTIWDHYKKLDHNIIRYMPSRESHLLIDQITPDPNNAIFWGDLFCDPTLNIYLSASSMGLAFRYFYMDVLEKCPQITMIGRDHLGYPITNKLVHK